MQLAVMTFRKLSLIRAAHHGSLGTEVVQKGALP